MRATTFIADSLTVGGQWLEGLVGDISGDDLIQGPGPNDAHHALWIIGHLTVSESSIVDRFIRGTEPGLADWESTYGMGSQPMADRTAYVSKAELLDAFRAERSKTLALLGTLDDGDLDKPSHAPEPLEGMFGTVGKCFLLAVNHQAFHVGQVADIRRTLGRSPLLA